MTPAERAEIERAVPSGVVLSFLPHEDSRFVRLAAKPCPLLVANLCSVHAVRPMNCRRFACGREDVTTEPFVNEAIPARALTDRAFRRQLVVMQRKAQRWGRAHDWPEA